ncbi:uncharacterized protein LOC119674881, partial [Teleopsis dalmanni]|uniref:uncharacterized protein LOC119674881 n=1 Tax=Teleopsis dalmanni TaxID=139649 RepID=UPI0018CC8A82
QPEEPPEERDKPQKSSFSSKLLDKTKRRIRIVINENGDRKTNYNNLSKEKSSDDIKNINIDYNADYSLSNGLAYGGRNKNDKNWENWERIREQKLEKMKNICFESYRQSKRDRMQQAKPKPKQLDPTWYTDNIYSNHSEDLDDYVPDCIKYGTYRKLRNIREQDEFYADNNLFETPDTRERRGEGEGSPGYGLQRSTSCKEFQYPKVQSCSFSGNVYESGGTATLGAAPTPTSILKKHSNVPKSYSFSATSKTAPFDVMDYDLPRAANTRREKQEAFRKSMGYYISNSLDESTLTYGHDVCDTHICCAREHCTSAKCLLDDIYPSYAGTHHGWRRGESLGLYGASASGGSNRNLHTATDWIEDRNNHRVATASRYSLHAAREREQPLPPPPTMICCCANDDYCYHRQQQHHTARPRSRLYCPGHHPAAEEEEHMHCRAMSYDTDLEHYIRDERERLMMQDKFLDEDERYLAIAGPSTQYYRRPARSKSLLEVQPPSRYDDDTCSDSTEMDLEDFSIDLERYWEELEKAPSPIDIDMQRRNMHSNLKVKNVNVGCYNNGQPIDMHDREHERMMIKKSLLEGMPSPPQIESTTVPSTSKKHGINNATDFHFFDHASSPLHRSYNYGHKVYPATDTLPSYKYNNFYPEETVQTQQPTSGGHHPSAGGHSALSLINNIFSIYKPNKYSPNNCQMNVASKPDPCKKFNMPNAARSMGTSRHGEYMHSMKRPLIVSSEQPHFKIIPEKTGLKISPLYNYDDYSEKSQVQHKFSSSARPLVLPH